MRPGATPGARSLSALGWVGALVMLLSGAASAYAQERAAVPAWAPGLDVNALANDAGVRLPTRVRVTLSGTLTSTVDGERYDAFHRITPEGGQRVALFVLPPGATVVDQDYEAHSYVVELGAARALRLDPSVIARRSLSPVSEVRAGLRGAILVDLTTPHVVAGALPASASGAAAAPISSTTSLTTWAGLGAAATAPPVLLLGLMAFGRRRRRPARVLKKRITRAAEAVDREAARLGPAFDPLRTAADDAREEGRRLLAAHREARRARRRLRAFGGTGSRRFVELDETETKALRELAVLADRLADTAVSLASHDARSANAGDVSNALAHLGEELATAISADEEARQVA